MPYNNTPIAPSKEVSGQVSLPLARVQKIINADPERLHTSKNAAFAIALATELFIQHMASASHNVVKAETQKKPRRNVQYRDVAAAVSKTDNLEFLVDVVPKTVLYKDWKKKSEGGKEAKKVVVEGEGMDREKEDVGEGSALDRLMTSGARGRKVVGGLLGKEKGKDKEEDDTPVPAPAPVTEAETEAGAEAMEVDEDVMEKEAKEGPVERVEESEPEDDGAAMQIEMEMRGPRKATPEPPRRSGGFTAINGRRK